MGTCGCRPPYFPEWKNFSDCTFSEHASCISPNLGSHSTVKIEWYNLDNTLATTPSLGDLGTYAVKNQIVSLLFSISLTATKIALLNANGIVMFVMLNMESITSQYTGHWKNFLRQQEIRILTLLHFRLCNSSIIVLHALF